MLDGGGCSCHSSASARPVLPLFYISLVPFLQLRLTPGMRCHCTIRRLPRCCVRHLLAIVQQLAGALLHCFSCAQILFVVHSFFIGHWCERERERSNSTGANSTAVSALTMAKCVFVHAAALRATFIFYCNVRLRHPLAAKEKGS